MKSIEKIQQIDQKIQVYFDRVLPRNLTVRYIVGLALIAALSLAGHIVIRMSLTNLSQDERMIRKLAEQIDKSEAFYREIIYLQTISNDLIYRERITELDTEIFKLIRNHYVLMSELNRLSTSDSRAIQIIRANAQEAFEFLEESYKRISNIKFTIDASSVQLNDPILIAFIRSENTYRDHLSRLSRRYEIDSQNNLNYFQNIETALLFLILLTLILEGLYVFRPAVKRVYEAIQLRTEFLSKMSHEIRNPMNSILGMAQLLSKTRMNSQQQNYIKILENSSNGLLEMLNNLLDFASLEAGKMKVDNVKTDLYDVIDKSIDLITVKVQEKNLDLVVDIDKEVPLLIISDPVKLQQIIVNLLSNAAKFTERGFISLQVKIVEIMEVRNLQIVVHDSGVGIESVKVEAIFESFVQENSSIRRKYGGTGLGLSIAKEILNLMNGNITLESKKGEGSKFTVILPLKVANEVKTLEKFIPHKLFGRKFLLIDDHEKSSLVMQKLITDYGGRLERIRPNENFDNILGHIKADGFEKILIDSTTFSTQLEEFLKFLKENGVATNRICILFRYLHTNYLFDTLTEIGITQVFPKPIKPIEFINYLSGLSSLAEKENLIEYGNMYEHSDHRFKVLVAEDSADNRMLIQMYLEKVPVDLFFAENGLKALELFQQHRFDIILMDIQMPEMDGKTAAQYIRTIEKEKRLHATPILAFSAHKPREINYEEGSGLFNDFVIKPVSADTVKAKLAQYLKFSNSIKEKNKVTTSNQMDIDLSDLIPSYLERRVEDLKNIEVLCEREDFQTIARLGHQIKGTAKSYGFEDFGLLAHELEKSALESDQEKITNVLSEMKSRIRTYQKNHMH